MGYNLHITRATVWTESDWHPIAMEEWLEYVRSDLEMRLDGYADAPLPEGGTLRYENDGLAVWTAHSRHGVGGNMAWFNYSDGEIRVKNPDQEMRRKMYAIAVALGAKVQGDEEEIYDAAGNMASAERTRRTRRSQDGGQVFELSSSAPSHGVLWLVGGLVAMGIAVLGFVLQLILRVDPITRQFLTTLPAMAGIGAFTAAWTIARTPRQVVIGDDCLRIGTGKGSRSHRWAEIGWSTVQTVGMTQRRRLRVYDVRGRTIARLSDSIEGFDSLVKAVARRIASRKDDTAERLRISKSRKMAIVAALVAVGMLAGSATIAWTTHADARAEQLLSTAAIPGEGVVEDRFLAPNGITCRIVYRVTTPDGRSATRNVEVPRDVWEELKKGQIVPVVYAPEDPSISRFALGEVEDSRDFKNPLFGYGFSVLAVAIAMFLLLAAALFWKGWTIDMDRKTGRLAVKRFGTTT